MPELNLKHEGRSFSRLRPFCSITRPRLQLGRAENESSKIENGCAQTPGGNWSTLFVMRQTMFPQPSIIGYNLADSGLPRLSAELTLSAYSTALSQRTVNL